MDFSLGRDYGPLKQNFSYNIKSGYSVLVGPNNSGKSAMLQYIFQWLVREVGEYGPDKVALLLPNRIYIDQSIQSGDRELVNHNQSLADQIANSPLTFFGAVGPSGAELFKLLITHYDLESQLSQLRGLLEKVELPKQIIGPRQSVLFDGKEIGVQGSGLRGALSILAALTDPKIKVLLIDEPETSLEPKVQRLLRNLFYEKGQEKTIIVATQSHLFLNRKSFMNNTKVWKDASEVTRTEDLTDEIQLYDLSFNLLGSSLGDLFFPENFMIVEGLSDEVIVNKIIELKNLDRVKVRVVSASGLEKVNNTKEMIVEVLRPLVLRDSPYKKKVVALIDKRNDQNRKNVEDLKKELGTRLFELNASSLEEYIPAEIYSRASRDKDTDVLALKNLGGNYQELRKLKKSISNAIASVIEVSDLVQLRIIDKAVERAFQ